MKPNMPDHALVVTEYDEFRKLVRAHAEGHYELLVAVGPPGVAKTEIVTRTMQEVHGAGRWASIRGKHSPLDLYRRLYENRLHPIVLDDLDGLLAKSDNTAILKCVCDTRPVKLVEWGSYHASFAVKDALPMSFESISRVCLIANEWSTINRNVAALNDRGLTIAFQPTALAVHREVATGGWFDDSEVFDFIGQHLHLLVAPSFRFYLTAREHKRAGLDWRGLVLRTIESAANPELLLVAKLLADRQFDELPAPEAARERAFKARGGGSRATYHRHKQRLLAARGTPHAEAAVGFRLGPQQCDPFLSGMLERRQHLESLRDASHETGGKLPLAVDQPVSPQANLDGKAAAIAELERQLQQAIEREDYEAATKLRDEIRRFGDG